MRKSRRHQPPPTFVLLRDALPQFAKLLETNLRKIGNPKLAAQVSDLRIYGKCPCKAPNCGTFYCATREEYKRLARFSSDDIYGVGVTTAKGKIIRVETLDPEIDTVLDRLFPDLGNANPDAW